MANRYYQIIFEDDDIVAINKSPGIAVLKERKPDGAGDSLFELLKKDVGENLLIVHRIDKETSGIMLFAKNPISLTSLSDSFASRQIEKKYLALVEGKVESSDWTTIDLPILKQDNKFKVSINKKGKEAVTKFRTLENFRHATLLEVKILTGRTHQIRVHLKHHGTPLLVDPVYGNRDAFFLSEILHKKYKRGKNQVENPLIARQTLHASSIGLKHPKTREMLYFEAPIPKDLRATLNQLRKASRYYN
jgi:RluA family pseudouridine synthase